MLFSVLPHSVSCHVGSRHVVLSHVLLVLFCFVAEGVICFMLSHFISFVISFHVMSTDVWRFISCSSE